MAKANSKKILSKKVNNLLENCTIEQIEVEDYIEKLMECGFMSPQAVQQRKETTNNLRYWFVVYIPKLYSHLAFYQTTSETAFKVKTKSKDIYELPENISSLLLHSGERKPIHRFVDISRGIFIPGDVFAPANVQNDKQDFAYWQQEQLKEVASDLESVIPFHVDAEDTYKIFTKELFQSSRKVWYEKRLIDGSVESTEYYYPKLIYCLQFIFRARNLEFVRNQLKTIHSIKDAEVRQTNLKKVESFLKEVQQIYDRCVNTLYKTMYMISKMDESALAKAEEARDMILQRVAQGYVQKIRNGKLYFVNDKNEVVDEYPEIFMMYYRILSSADALAKNIQKFYDKHAKGDAKHIAMPFTRYSTYDAQWMELFSKVIHKQDKLNNADESELKKNIALEDAFSALQNAQKVEKERLKSELLALQKEEAAQQKQRAFVLSLEQSKKNLENFICKQFIPIVLEYKHIKETLKTHKISHLQDFKKQVDNKFASCEGLPFMEEEFPAFGKNAVYNESLVQSFYEDLALSDKAYEECLSNEKLQQFIANIKTMNFVPDDTKSQEYVPIKKFIERAETGVLTEMTQAANNMFNYITIANACLDRYHVVCMYTDARSVFVDISNKITLIEEKLSKLPVLKEQVLQDFHDDIQKIRKQPPEFLINSQIDMKKIQQYQQTVSNCCDVYAKKVDEVSALYKESKDFVGNLTQLLEEQRCKLRTGLDMIERELDVPTEMLEPLKDNVLMIFDCLADFIYEVDYTTWWKDGSSVETTMKNVRQTMNYYKENSVRETQVVCGKFMEVFSVLKEANDLLNCVERFEDLDHLKAYFIKVREKAICKFFNFLPKNEIKSRIIKHCMDMDFSEIEDKFYTGIQKEVQEKRGQFSSELKDNLLQKTILVVNNLKEEVEQLIEQGAILNDCCKKIQQTLNDILVCLRKEFGTIHKFEGTLQHILKQHTKEYDDEFCNLLANITKVVKNGEEFNLPKKK